MSDDQMYFIYVMMGMKEKQQNPVNILKQTEWLPHVGY